MAYVILRYVLQQFILLVRKPNDCSKALAAKNLKESQKGAIYLSLFKVFGPLFTVLPGVVAYNYFNGSIKTPDNAYPALVSSVLPDWAFGLFGAVIFGAILSSFVGSLNSTTTLLTLDFYKPIFGKNKSDKHIARVGHIATIVIGAIVVGLRQSFHYSQVVYTLLYNNSMVFTVCQYSYLC